MCKFSLSAMLIGALAVIPAFAVAEDQASAQGAAVKEEVKKEEAKAEEGAKAGEPKKEEGKVKVDAFAEALKRQDPAAYETFVKLRTERDKQLEELKRIQGEMKKASSEEKINLYQQFRIAKKKYAESYLGFIDFLDDRDKKAIARYEENVERLNTAIARVKDVMEKRKKARDELQKAMKDE